MKEIRNQTRILGLETSSLDLLSSELFVPVLLDLTKANSSKEFNCLKQILMRPLGICFLWNHREQRKNWFHDSDDKESIASFAPATNVTLLECSDTNASNASLTNPCLIGNPSGEKKTSPSSFQLLFNPTNMNLKRERVVLPPKSHFSERFWNVQNQIFQMRWWHWTFSINRQPNFPNALMALDLF